MQQEQLGGVRAAGPCNLTVIGHPLGDAVLYAVFVQGEFAVEAVRIPFGVVGVEVYHHRYQVPRDGVLRVRIDQVEIAGGAVPVGEGAGRGIPVVLEGMQAQDVRSTYPPSILAPVQQRGHYLRVEHLLTGYIVLPHRVVGAFQGRKRVNRILVLRQQHQFEMIEH